MIEQQKILLDLFKLMEKKDGFIPKEYKPRQDELYRYCWKVKNVHETDFEIVQINECLYFTADTKSFAKNDELKILQLLNYLNGWSYYGIFTYSSLHKTIMYEQTHFCRQFCYSKEEIYDFIFGMTKRMGLYYQSADLIFNNNIPIVEAVNNAKLNLKKRKDN